MPNDKDLWQSGDTGIEPVTGAGRVLDSARLARLLFRNAADGTDQHSVRVDTMGADLLLSRIAGDVAQQLCQVVAVGSEHRSHERATRAVLAELVSKQREVRRVYLVPAGQGGDESVNRRIEHDRRVGCVSAALEVKPQTGIPMDDLWLIDRAAVVRMDPAPVESPAWIVSTRPEEVTEAHDFWEKVWSDCQDASTAQVPQYPPDLTARLLASAPKFREVASVLCERQGTDDDEGACDWYHRIWQYLRLFNMVSSPSWHPEFYYGRLRRAIGEQGKRRILISGCADYSTLAFVLAAVREAGLDSGELVPQVVDRCRTALAACTWYADQVNARVSTHQLDITDVGTALDRLAPQPGATRFDVIVADAFLTRFDQEQAEQVVRSWHALLAPGGMIITTVRLHSRNADPYAPSASRPSYGVGDPIMGFQLRLRRRAEPWRRLLKTGIEDLCDDARQYALRMTSTDLGDETDIVALFEHCGFLVEPPEIAEVDGELVHTAYLRLVARKQG